MRRVMVLVVACLVLSGLTAQVAFAANPHFVGTDTSATGPDSVGNLAMKYKIAGLGNAGAVTTEATADAKATWACQKKRSGKIMNRTKKQVSAPVSDSISASPDVTGSVTGDLSLERLLPPKNLKCSKKKQQRKVLVDVEYQNVKLEGAGAEHLFSGAFSKKFFN